VDEENVSQQPQQQVPAQPKSPPPRPPPPQPTSSAAKPAAPVEDYDNLKDPAAGQVSIESPLSPRPPESELSITNCSDCCEPNDEWLNATDFSEHINSEQYPSLELSNQQGMRHVTSNFDSLPYQGAHWLMQQQQIDEEQRLIDMKQLQEEQQAEELRLYLEEIGVHENMKLQQQKLGEDAPPKGDVCCQVVRPIPVESDESYDNEPSPAAEEHLCHSEYSNDGEQEAETEEEKAAVTIQRMMKGHCARSRFERKKTAALAIQAHVRGFLTRKRVHDSRQRSQTKVSSFRSNINFSFRSQSYLFNT
uniref:CG8326 n=1 Tax=Macrostomum lignano TaxID=282301 RepID=A0A1I8HMN8_9PLAT